jgi:predicted RNase H-like HicB family nuclease
MTYTVVLRREPEGGYTVLVPALPGCLTCGDTIEEALEMAREVVPAFVEVLEEDGKPAPPDQPDVHLNMRDMEEALVYRLTVGEEVGVA